MFSHTLPSKTVSAIFQMWLGFFSTPVLAKFTFLIIVSYSALRIDLYLFYKKKGIAQLKERKKRKNVKGHRTRLRENDDLPPCRAPAIKKKPPFFNARANHA